MSPQQGRPMASSGSAAGTAPARTEEKESATRKSEMDEVDAVSAASMDASDPPAFCGATGVGGVEVYGDERQRRISERAYELWLAAGSPKGIVLEFWLAAERELYDGSGHRGAGR